MRTVVEIKDQIQKLKKRKQAFAYSGCEIGEKGTEVAITALRWALSSKEEPKNDV